MYYMDSTELHEYMQFAKKAARMAGDVMQAYYYADQHVEIKDDDSPVTIADKEINAKLIDLVKAEYPLHGVLGEEESWNPERNLLWVCDPIDGTQAFMSHLPMSMFSLALVEDGRPLVAVAYNPWTNQLYEATKGSGALRNGVSIAVSDRKWAAKAVVLGSSSAISRAEAVDNSAIRAELWKKSIAVINAPGTVFKGCLVAEGSADGRTFVHSGAHDVAAIKLIIEEAGGKVTDLDGNEQRYDGPINGAVMSNGVIHDELLNLVKQHANTRH